MDDMPAESEKGITVRTGIAPGLVVLTVIDTGPGIASENQEHIFEPLFSTKSYGTGLGLSIVKQIVDQHGGIIRVDSEPGHGTRAPSRARIPCHRRTACAPGGSPARGRPAPSSRADGSRPCRAPYRLRRQRSSYWRRRRLAHRRKNPPHRAYCPAAMAARRSPRTVP